MPSFDQLISNTKPKQWFLIDAMGALGTACTLGIAWPYFDDLMDLPLSTLYFLAAVAIAFFCYSLSCFLLAPAKWWRFLRVIAFANLSYCLLTSLLIINYWDQLPVVGLMYLVGELIIIATIASLELRKAQRAKESDANQMRENASPN